MSCPIGIAISSARQPRTERNPFHQAVAKCGQNRYGKVLRILTNDLDAPAQEIADLYKRRWAIELFFSLGQADAAITHFLGTSETLRDSGRRRPHRLLLLPWHKPPRPPAQSASLRPPRPRQPHASARRPHLAQIRPSQRRPTTSSVL